MRLWDPVWDLLPSFCRGFWLGWLPFKKEFAASVALIWRPGLRTLVWNLLPLCCRGAAVGRGLAGPPIRKNVQHRFF